MALITISAATINYAAGTTDCQCSVATDVPTVGLTYIGRSVSLASADLCPDWTDAQLCEAVAAKLGVPASDVAVAPGPVLPDPAAPFQPVAEAVPVVADQGEGAES